MSREKALKETLKKEFNSLNIHDYSVNIKPDEIAVVIEREQHEGIGYIIQQHVDRYCEVCEYEIKETSHWLRIKFILAKREEK